MIKITNDFFTPKQVDFFNDANHRWNIKSGATRSGKTFMDYFILPERITERKGKKGLTVFLGVNKGSIQRNLIDPLQDIYGTILVSDIKSDNTARIFGEKVYCLGTEKINSVNRIRGSSIKYLYGDEFAEWHESVFQMVKSRMDKPYSLADLTCNPGDPEHWAHEFMTSDADIYLQEYELDDNTKLDKSIADELKKEYAGTVFYDRFILGKWVRAEGSCFVAFRDDWNVIKSEKEKKEIIDKIMFIEIGCDIGGGGSATAYTAMGYYMDSEKGLCAAALEELYDTKNISADAIRDNFKNFTIYIRGKYGKNISLAAVDSAEQLIKKSFARSTTVRVVDSMKKPILDRIRMIDYLFAERRYVIFDCCPHLISAYHAAVWNTKNPAKTERLDNGTTNIDSLDSSEYTLERHMTDFMRFYKK